jgi:DNA-binding Lrp family transcriptional regulator
MPMSYRVFRMVEAFILVRTGSSETLNLVKTVKEEIGKIKGVKEVFGILGRYDFAVRVETKTTEALGSLVADRIRGIHGVTYTETLVIGF